MYSVILLKAAVKNFKKIDRRYQILINKALIHLRTEPRIGRPLRGELEGLWKLRVSSYRIIYQIVDKKLLVYVVDIDNRKQVYR